MKEDVVLYIVIVWVFLTGQKQKTPQAKQIDCSHDHAIRIYPGFHNCRKALAGSLVSILCIMRPDPGIFPIPLTSLLLSFILIFCLC